MDETQKLIDLCPKHFKTAQEALYFALAIIRPKEMNKIQKLGTLNNWKWCNG